MIRVSMFFRLPQLRVLQRTPLVVSFVVLTAMTACVEESTYQAVQTEIAEVRRQLAVTKDEVSQLTSQVARLQQTKQEQEHNVIELLEALQKEKDAEVLWQKKVREKTDALVARLNAMQNQQRWLARETKLAVNEQATLEELVAKYKGQLQDSAMSPEPVISPAPRDMDQTVSQPTSITPPTPTPPPAVSPALPPPQPESVPQPARQKPTPEPQDDSWFSTFKGWLGSLWRMIFS
jgi:myosin heavy subunit